MIHSSDHLRKLINDFIKCLPYDRQPTSLYTPIRYALSVGGKRMRPVLMLMAYNLFKDNPEKILLIATALETYHNFTLLHDDLMDKSDLRRGRLTVHKKWNDNVAILSGDTMIVLAYKYMACCDKNKLSEVLNCFTQTALEIGEGQQMDMDFEARNDVTEDEYIEMIRLKTSVLLACAMKMGAILAEASDKDQALLYNLGESIGLAFQLQDDYLDVYGDESVFGKPIGGDICNNKKTFMLINACLRAKGVDKENLESWLSVKSFDAKEKIASVTTLYNKLGISQLAQERIAFYFEEANKYIDAISVGEDRKTELRHYIESLRHREV